MALPDVVTREQWLAARTELLAAEKEATRSRDALNTRRRQLPMVRIDQDYTFDGEQGTVPLTALLDLTALGRQEDWEQPAGRAPRLHGADPTFTD